MTSYYLQFPKRGQIEGGSGPNKTPGRQADVLSLLTPASYTHKSQIESLLTKEVVLDGDAGIIQKGFSNANQEVPKVVCS